MAVCRSGGDYRHASIAPVRGASASVIQVCSPQPMSLAVMVVADMVCGRYGRTPLTYSAATLGKSYSSSEQCEARVWRWMGIEGLGTEVSQRGPAAQHG